MKSMTGHGSGVWKSKDCCIEATLQSYNHKNFETRLQLPAFYSTLEGELRKELQKKFIRGAFNLFITRNPSWPAKQTIARWNKKQALSWKALYNNMAKSLKMKNDLSLFNLSQQPGVLEVFSPSCVVSAKEKSNLKTLVRQVISLCNKEKIREGQALKRDFQKHLKHLLLCLQNIKKHESRQRKAKTRQMESQLIAFEGEEQKTAQDIAGAFIDRMDISEEISRLKEHIKTFSSLIKGPGVMGKKMSFYLQEMIREANTIGSKSQDFKLTKEVVQAKSLIERMREQAHNIE